MSGLDPVGRREVRELIQQLHDEGKTVFFSTHILSDAEVLCDRIAVLNNGHLEQIGTPDEVYNHPATEFVATFLGSPWQPPSAASSAVIATRNSITLSLFLRGVFALPCITTTLRCETVDVDPHPRAAR